MHRVLAFINPRLSTRNVGDLFIEDAVKRILSYDAAESIDIDPRQPITDQHIEAINRCDAAVIVGTNLWYRQLARPGRWCFSAEQLQSIRVPIIPLGVGTTRHAGEDNAFDDDTRLQLKIIHDSCHVASARDERTREALAEAGIRNVALTGCPTLFRSLAAQWTMRPLDSERPSGAPSPRASVLPVRATPYSALGVQPYRRMNHVALTVRKGQRRNVRLLTRLLRRQGYSMTVAAQQDKDRFLSWGIPWVAPSVPTLYRYDIAPYVDLVERSFGAIGCRLHGNMFHLAHGNPAVFLANCSRAQSFCETFELPCYFCPDHEPLSESQLAAGVERLADQTEYVRFAERYAHFHRVLGDTLVANGLEHRLKQAEPVKKALRRAA